MYNQKLAVAIKTAGKVLREQGDKIFLPFGSEFTIFLKNLNSVRALVRVSIDGQSIGDDLVIYGNTELDLERFLTDKERGNKFKFIERSSKVEQHRGIGAEDGLVRVEFQFEKIEQKTTYTHTHEYHHHHHDYYWPTYYPQYPYNPYYPHLTAPTFWNASIGDVPLNVNVSSVGVNDVQCSYSADATSSGTGNMLRSANFGSNIVNSTVQQPATNDQGITVAGSVSDQKFQTASWFQTEEEKHVIVLKLLGQVGGNIVEKAITTKTAQVCQTCGTRNRGKFAQFCRECGTALDIIGQSSKRVEIR